MSGQYPYPIKDDGFLDEKKIFQMVIGTLKCPLNYLDDLSPLELGWLFEQHIEDKMEHYELISSSVSFGYVNANSKKQRKMFKKQEKEKIITEEEKEKDIKYLQSMFGGESN